MAASINKVVVIGNLTKDPELRHTPSGTAVASLSVACNSREKDPGSGEWGDRADFFDVTVWGEQAEACAQYLAKGNPVGVDGRLKQDRWEDASTGQKRSKVVIIAHTVQFLPKRGDDDEAAAGQAAREAADTSADFFS